VNRDIRITVGLVDHPKTIKLIRRCGEGAFRCLVRLWCYAAEYRPVGILHGMDDTDIAIASGWQGDEAEWVGALKAVGFLDDVEGETSLALHDWEEHNPFAFHAEDRSEKARNAAKERWAKRNNAKSNAGSMLRACNEHQSSNAPSPNPDSEANASGADAPADLKSMVFGQGLDWLAKQSGKPKDKLRSALGRACRDHGEARVIEVLGAAQREGPIDPLAWMERAFKARASPRSPDNKTKNNIVVGSPEWKELEAQGLV